jgi:ferric-dicitrate binding protein FerR (iron transport regulator)
MNAQLERLFHAALKSAAAGGASARDAASEQFDMQKLLAHIGLQSKRRPGMGATLGLFAGLVAGAALAVWLAPMIKKQIELRRAPGVISKKSATNSSMHDEAAV